MLDVTILAVTKVIIAVLVGAYTANTIPYRASTIRDFSFLISNVLLPCITIANTAKSVTIELLIRCSVLVFFAILLISIGVVTALIMSVTLFRTPARKTGIPLEMQDDVRLELRYEEEAEEEARRADSAEVVATPPTAGTRTGKKKKPYVAVVLSEQLRARGVTGRDVVPLLDIPSPELEAQPGYFWGSIVGCSIQNTVTLPLSLLQNLAQSVPWVQFEQGSAYIFVFSTVCTLYLWSCGPSYVETAQKQSLKLRTIREIMTQHKRHSQQCDAFTQTEVKANSTFSPVAQNGAVPDFPSRHTAGETGTAKDVDGEEDSNDYPLPHISATTAPSASTPRDSFAASSVTTTFQVTHQSSQVDFGSPSMAQVPKFFAPTTALDGQIPYDWQTAGFLRVVYAGDVDAAAEKTNRVASFLHAAKSLGWRLLTNVPFMAIVVSILIGITPPLRGLFFDGGALAVLMDSITMISQGCIPCSLLLLGVNLAGSTGSQSVEDPNAQRQLRHSEQNTDFPLYAQDLELIGEDTAHAVWYNEQHARLGSDIEDRSAEEEFDEYASFSLHDLIQRNAEAREREAQLRQERLANMSLGALSDGRSDAVVVSSGTSTTTNTTPQRAGTSRPSNTSNALEDMAPHAAPGVLASVRSALNVEGVRKLFIWGTIGIRLIILPAISFSVLLLLIKGAPSLFGSAENQDKTLILVLFLELAAPTAINSALLFNQRQYMTYPWAKMLFFQYILCSVTLVMWATVGLATVEAL